MVACGNCGFKNEEGSKFCSKCGVDVTVKLQHSPNLPKKSKKPVIIIFIIGIIAVAAVIIATFIVMENRHISREREALVQELAERAATEERIAEQAAQAALEAEEAYHQIVIDERLVGTWKFAGQRSFGSGPESITLYDDATGSVVVVVLIGPDRVRRDIPADIFRWSIDDDAQLTMVIPYIDINGMKSSSLQSHLTYSFEFSEAEQVLTLTIPNSSYRGSTYTRFESEITLAETPQPPQPPAVVADSWREHFIQVFNDTRYDYTDNDRYIAFYVYYDENFALLGIQSKTGISVYSYVNDVASSVNFGGGGWSGGSGSFVIQPQWQSFYGVYSNELFYMEALYALEDNTLVQRFGGIDEILNTMGTGFYGANHNTAITRQDFFQRRNALTGIASVNPLTFNTAGEAIAAIRTINTQTHYDTVNISQLFRPEADFANTEYIIPHSNTRLITIDDIQDLSTNDLRLARNEIYARNGRMFDSADLQAYFGAMSWYNGTIPAADFRENMLSEIERANIATIQAEEGRR